MPASIFTTRPDLTRITGALAAHGLRDVAVRAMARLFPAITVSGVKGYSA